MSPKQVFFYLACAVTWFVLLPVLVVGGTLTLVVYAIVSELNELILGTSKSMDNATAREIARRMCLGS